MRLVSSILVPTATTVVVLTWLWQLRRSRQGFTQAIRAEGQALPKPPKVDLIEGCDRSNTFSVKHELSSEPSGLQMWVADMELQCCPAIVRAISERAAHANYGYTIQPSAAWDAIAAWLFERQGWPSPPARSDFVFSASVVTSFCNVLRAFTAEGDGVVVMTPLYAPLQRAVTGCGRRLVEHRLAFRDRCVFGEEESPTYQVSPPLLTFPWPPFLPSIASCQMDVSTRLAARLDAEAESDRGRVKLLLLCNPHNPSGRVWRRPELAALAAECAHRGILVISDEIWADWVLPSGSLWPFVPFTSVATPAGCAHCTLGAPTKSFSLAGLHASYLVLPDAELRRKYLAYADPALPHSPAHSQPRPVERLGAGTPNRPSSRMARRSLQSRCSPPTRTTPRAGSGLRSATSCPTYTT